MTGPLRTTSTTEALVAELRRSILGGRFAPGSSLTELGLAETFGVARPTVRTALQELVDRRLLVRERGRSATVPVLTVADVEDLYYLRTPLELRAVETLVRLRDPLPGAESVLRRLEAMPGDAGWGERVEAHGEFHTALIDAVGSSRMSRVYASLQEETQLCLAQLQSSYPDPAELAREHRELLDVIRTGTAARARTVMRDHLQHAVDNFTSTRPPVG